MAAAMLNALRRTDKPEARLAADALVQAFVADVTAACADDPGLPDEKKIVSIPATLVYLESGPKYRP